MLSHIFLISCSSRGRCSLLGSGLKQVPESQIYLSTIYSVSELSWLSQSVCCWSHLRSPAGADGAEFVLTNLASDLRIQTDTNCERRDSASLIHLLDWCVADSVRKLLMFQCTKLDIFFFMNDRSKLTNLENPWRGNVGLPKAHAGKSYLGYRMSFENPMIPRLHDIGKHFLHFFLFLQYMYCI